LVVAGSLVVAGVASATSTVVSLKPGDSLTVSCPDSSLVTSSSAVKQDVLTCRSLSDLVVTAVSVSPANPAPGQALTFSATVQNIGQASTPAGFGTAFFVDGVKVSWNDATTTHLAAGASAVYTADDGPTGSATWADSPGTHTVEANTNDTKVFNEVSFTNNTKSISLAVPSPPTPTTSPSTTTTAPVSSMAAPAGYSSSQLVFDDAFGGSTLNASHWRNYISDANSSFYPWNADAFGGSGSNPGSYDAEYFEPSAVTVNNGLSLSATSGSSRSGYSWTSGVVSTQGHFALARGYLQVKAWMPDMTTGMWPGIWLMGNASELPEVDLYEGGYTPNPNSAFAANLHVSGASQQFAQTNANLAGGWHTYGIDYEPGSSITMYLDGYQVAKYTTNVPSGPYFLLLDLQVAQNTTGWHTLVGSSTPSPSVMKVAEVQAYGTAG
jgi:hypothetical protein